MLHEKFDQYWLYKVYNDWSDSDHEFNMNEFIKIFGHDNKQRGFGWKLNQWLFE
jgi:hypothetical protein